MIIYKLRRDSAWPVYFSSLEEAKIERARRIKEMSFDPSGDLSIEEMTLVDLPPERLVAMILNNYHSYVAKRTVVVDKVFGQEES